VIRRGFVPALALALCWPAFVSAESASQSGGELHFCLRGEPKTFNPLLVEEDSSETIRYLTGGALIRLNRQTQALEPGLAVSWIVSEEGRGRPTSHESLLIKF
jgi:ABC-type transport system substrate-binding protein